MSHFEQYLLSLNKYSSLSLILIYNIPSPIFKANSTDSVILCLDFLLIFNLSINTSILCFLFLLNMSLSYKFLISLLTRTLVNPCWLITLRVSWCCPFLFRITGAKIIHLLSVGIFKILSTICWTVCLLTSPSHL